MTEMLYSSIAILLLVNPHRNNGTARSTYVFIVCKEDASLPAMFNPLCSNMNQQLFKKTSAVKVAIMKIMDNSCYEWKLSRVYHKIDTFRGEKKTKEGTDKSMKNALHVQWYGKRHLLGRSDVEQWKNKPLALAIVELRKSEGIGKYVVNQSVSRKFN